MPEGPTPFIPIEGGCGCQKIRYRIDAAPIVIHCCYCTRCMCETGSAFVLNYIIEKEKAIITSGEEELLLVDTPTDSGTPQTMYAA